MTISVASFILLLCSLLTGLIVEAFKKMLVIDKLNIFVAVVSVFVGAVVSISYILMNHIVFDISTVLFVISIIVLSWLSAMLGYDKVVQTLSQLKR